MLTSLQYQTVYYQRDKVVRPATYLILGVFFLLSVMLLKIWVKVGVVEAGYQLADYKKQNQLLIKEQKELELQKAILLRADHFKLVAAELGLKTISATQMQSLK